MDMNKFKDMSLEELREFIKSLDYESLDYKSVSALCGIVTKKLSEKDPPLPLKEFLESISKRQM